MEETRAVQGQGYFLERGDDQTEGQEDSVNLGIFFLWGSTWDYGFLYMYIGAHIFVSYSHIVGIYPINVFLDTAWSDTKIIIHRTVKKE